MPPKSPSKPPASQPPPSAAIPKSGGNLPYIAGVLVLGGLIALLLFMRKGDEPKPTPPPAPASAPTETAPQTLNAPPPPPKIEELDAGTEAGTKVGGKGPPGAGPCGKCGDGQSSPALNTALRSTAASAQGCYNRALRSSEASGSMTVSVQVGPSGNVCGASIVNDTVHNGEISACVKGRFAGRSFPPPTSGCVVVNIPINFTIKQ